MTALPDYFINVFCPITTQTWLPQRRDRLIILGTRRRFDWREPVATRRITLVDILEDEPRVEIPAYVAKRIAGAARSPQR